MKNNSWILPSNFLSAYPDVTRRTNEVILLTIPERDKKKSFGSILMMTNSLSIKPLLNLIPQLRLTSSFSRSNLPLEQLYSFIDQTPWWLLTKYEFFT